MSLLNHSHPRHTLTQHELEEIQNLSDALGGDDEEDEKFGERKESQKFSKRPKSKEMRKGRPQTVGDLLQRIGLDVSDIFFYQFPIFETK